MTTEWRDAFFGTLTHKVLPEGFGVYLEPSDITHFAVATIRHGGDSALEPLVATLHLGVKRLQPHRFSVKFFWDVKCFTGNPFTEQHSAIQFSHALSEAMVTLNDTEWGFDWWNTSAPLDGMKTAFEYLCWYSEWQGTWNLVEEEVVTISQSDWDAMLGSCEWE